LTGPCSLCEYTATTTLNTTSAARIFGPSIYIQWASTDQAVLDWLKDSARSISSPQLTSHTVSGGVLAGIVTGAVAGLALVIGCIVLLLHQCQRRYKAIKTTRAQGNGICHVHWEICLSICRLPRLRCWLCQRSRERRRREDRGHIVQRSPQPRDTTV
jgi:hypothetical protein